MYHIESSIPASWLERQLRILKTFAPALVCLAAGTLFFTVTKSTAASIAVSLDCDRASGFLPDPNQHKRVGYITSLDGFGLHSALTSDLKVVLPLSTSAPITYAPLKTATGLAQGGVLTAKVVGVISNLTWDGSVAGPLRITFYMSQENAAQLKASQQSTLKNAAVKSLGFWILDYDQERKVWFEALHPMTPAQLSGQVSQSASLNVDLTPVAAKDGIDVNVYRVDLTVVPAANQAATLLLANSSTKPMVKSWGLTVGTLASPASLPK